MTRKEIKKNLHWENEVRSQFQAERDKERPDKSSQTGITRGLCQKASEHQRMTAKAERYRKFWQLSLINKYPV